jgi:hypothetical protein
MVSVLINLHKSYLLFKKLNILSNSANGMTRDYFLSVNSNRPQLPQQQQQQQQLVLQLLVLQLSQPRLP